MATTTTETRRMIDWIQPAGRHDLRLDVTRHEDLGVAIIADGQLSWAAELEQWDRESIAQAHYEGDSETVIATDAYTDLCQAVPALDPTDERVSEACRQQELDPGALEY